MGSLKLLQIICRHGIRSPTLTGGSYPDDPNFEALVQLGPGQLTKQGRIQMFNLGKYLRERYENFLGDDIRSVRARSNTLDRCLDSASCVLTAMFPPKDVEHQVDPEINWQPIPVHSESTIHDRVLMHPEITEVYTELFVAPISEENQEHVKRISAAANLSIKNMYELGPICDVVLTEIDNNMSVPPQILSVLPNVRKVISNCMEFLTLGEKAEKFGGGLRDDVLSHLLDATSKKVSENTKKVFRQADTKKTLLYFTSDVFLHSYMKLLGIEADFPNYGSTLIVELHEIDGKDIVKIYFNNDTLNNISRFQILKLPNLDYECAVEEFAGFCRGTSRL